MWHTAVQPLTADVVPLFRALPQFHSLESGVTALVTLTLGKSRFKAGEEYKPAPEQEEGQRQRVWYLQPGSLGDPQSLWITQRQGSRGCAEAALGSLPQLMHRYSAGKPL